MIADLSEMIMFILYFYVIPVFSVAAAIISILIFTGKTRPVRILGWGIFFTALAQLCSQIMLLVTRSSQEMASRYAVPGNIVILILGFCSTVCLCIFVHKNYGRKYIYPLMLISSAVTTILSMFLPVVITRIQSNAGLRPGEAVYWTEMLFGIGSFLLGSVPNIIYVIVLIQNRKTEKIIPHYWLLRVLIYIWGIISLIVNSAGWRALIAAQDHAAVREAQKIRDVAQTTTGVIGAVIGLVIPVYILIASKRYSRSQQNNLEEQ